jgi:2-polyprenyl-3-methyl-5-hydroxy-6-metoxy-1,4-benzoquinol methylase
MQCVEVKVNMSINKQSLDARVSHEREFFDQRASEHGEDYSIKMNYGAALKRAKIGEGELKGMKVLDCGAGLGELAVWLAMRGARVTAIDVSPKSLEVLSKRATHHGVSQNITSRLLPMEQIDYGDASFDLVVGEFILHHVMLDKCMPQIRRVLRPGGMALFLETSATSKLLMFFRTHVIGHFGIPKFQDEIEYPLTARDIEYINTVFEGRCKVHYFPFTFVRMLDSHIFRYKIRFVSRLLTVSDRLIYKCLPFMRKYSYFKILELRK